MADDIIEGTHPTRMELLRVKNKLRLDIWQCACEQSWYADLVGVNYVPTDEDGGGPDSEETRVYSKALTPEQSEMVRTCRR